MGGPCFRIIQTHFARQNNVGDVAAKEQVSIIMLIFIMGGEGGGGGGTYQPGPLL